MPAPSRERLVGREVKVGENELSSRSRAISDACGSFTFTTRSRSQKSPRPGQPMCRHCAHSRRRGFHCQARRPSEPEPDGLPANSSTPTGSIPARYSCSLISLGIPTITRAVYPSRRRVRVLFGRCDLQGDRGFELDIAIPTPKHLRCIRAVERHAPRSSMMNRVHSRCEGDVVGRMSMAASSPAKRWAARSSRGSRPADGSSSRSSPGAATSAPAAPRVAFDRAKDDGRGLGQMADASELRTSVALQKPRSRPPLRTSAKATSSMTRGRESGPRDVEQKANPLSDLWQCLARQDRVATRISPSCGTRPTALEQSGFARTFRPSRAMRSPAAIENDTPERIAAAPGSYLTLTSETREQVRSCHTSHADDTADPSTASASANAPSRLRASGCCAGCAFPHRSSRATPSRRPRDPRGRRSWQPHPGKDQSTCHAALPPPRHPAPPWPRLPAWSR